MAPVRGLQITATVTGHRAISVTPNKLPGSLDLPKRKSPQTKYSHKQDTPITYTITVKHRHVQFTYFPALKVSYLYNVHLKSTASHKVLKAQP